MLKKSLRRYGIFMPAVYVHFRYGADIEKVDALIPWGRLEAHRVHID